MPSRKSRFSDPSPDSRNVTEPEVSNALCKVEPSTSQSNTQYDYLSKMFQPPKGTKFAARRNFLEKLGSHRESETQEAEKAVLTPGLKLEYERLQKQNLIPSDPFALENDGDVKEGSPVSDGPLSHHEEEQRSERNKSRDRGNSKERRHRSRSRSGNRSKRSKERRRSNSRGRTGETSSSHRSKRSRSRSRDRRRSRNRHRSRSRDNSKYKSSKNRGRNDEIERSPRGSKSKNLFNGKSLTSKNNRGANIPKPAKQRWNPGPKNVPNTQQQFNNRRGYNVIDKLEKLKMLDQFIETAKIYEEVIEPAEKAKFEGRQKQTPIKVKSADDATIAKTLESNLVCAKNLGNVTSQKRLVSLMSTMRFYLNQMNVDAQKFDMYFDSYLRKYCAWMGWDSISARDALLVDLKDRESDPLKDFRYSMDEPFKCDSCSLLYPTSKFPCATCSQSFNNLPELFAHDYSAHGRLVQPTFSCFVCQQPFGADPISFSRHFTLEHLCRSGHSECAVGCKTLIIGSSYLDLENHSAAHHKCKICGDLLGDSLPDHLSFFHPSIDKKDYLPEIFFEPVIDPDLARLNDLLDTFQDIKRQNPHVLEDNSSNLNSQDTSSNFNNYNQYQSYASDNVTDITEVNPIPNVHRYLTTKEAQTITSLNVAGSETARKSFVESNDVDSFFGKYHPDDVSRSNYPSQNRNCIYLDSARDPRLKSEFYNWKGFFDRLNREHDNEISLEDRLFGNGSDLESSRSHGLQFDFKLLHYVESSSMKRCNFDDLVDIRIPSVPVTLTIDPTDRNIASSESERSPITRKRKKIDYGSNVNNGFAIKSEPQIERTRYTTHDDGVLDIGDSFEEFTDDWDPKYDRIIHDFSDTESSKSRRDSFHDGFIVSNASSPRKNSDYSRNRSTYSSPQKVLNRDPRLQLESPGRDSGIGSYSQEKFGASSFRTSESWEPGNLRGRTEKERTAEAIALFLMKQ